MEVLRLNGLCKNYGGVQILLDLYLSVEQGEYVAVIGPNGAGKTTLLNIITGALSASTGRVFMFGHDVTTMPTYKRVHLGMGRSFQITRLLGKLTVLQNMLLGLHGIAPSRYQMLRPAIGYSELMAKCQELLESIDLWDKRNEPAQAISYGQQRKLEIALSLASKSKLLLLDEPTAGLSIAEIPLFVETIRALAKGTTVLFTSHDMDVVFALASRVIVLYYGQIIAQGTPEEIRCNSKVTEIYLGINQERVNAQVG